MMKWLRVCAACAYSLPPIDLFCERCWEKLSDKILMVPEPNQKEVPFPFRYLWDWRNSDTGGENSSDNLVECLVYSLKNARLPEAHARLSRWLVQHNYNFLEPRPSSIVFPMKDPAKKDHAYYLAHALGKLFGAPAVPLLIATTEKSYRGLGRKERYRARQIQRESGAELGDAILFVDDVLTTGATAYRAWQAVGEKPGFRVCVLAFKNLKSVEEERWITEEHP